MLPRGTWIPSFITSCNVLESWFVSCKGLKTNASCYFYRLEGFIFGPGNFMISKKRRDVEGSDLGSGWPCFALNLVAPTVLFPSRPTSNSSANPVCPTLLLTDRKAGSVFHISKQSGPDFLLCMQFCHVPTSQKRKENVKVQEKVGCWK